MSTCMPKDSATVPMSTFEYAGLIWLPVEKMPRMLMSMIRCSLIL